MIREQTRVTMTTTKTNYVSTATGTRAKTKGIKSSTTKKKFVQMKWVQVIVNGEKLGKEFQVPADCTDYTKHFERLMAAIPKNRVFWMIEEDDVEIKERLVLHTGRLNEYRKILYNQVR